VNPEELRAFLERGDPALVGAIGTLREDGFPHVVPVWYRWDGRAILIWTDDGRQWARNIMRDPRVGFTVSETRAPFGGVSMRGVASVSAGRDDWILAEMRRITERYLPGPEADAFLEAWSTGPQMIVRLEPSVINSWKE
jgi:hypothetical protein